ncbi:MAG: hypothetical protein ACFFG0_09625 [Candidatus Thorarchaeota archaeon]
MSSQDRFIYYPKKPCCNICSQILITKQEMIEGLCKSCIKGLKQAKENHNNLKYQEYLERERLVESKKVNSISGQISFLHKPLLEKPHSLENPLVCRNSLKSHDSTNPRIPNSDPLTEICNFLNYQGVIFIRQKEEVD